MGDFLMGFYHPHAARERLSPFLYLVHTGRWGGGLIFCSHVLLEKRRDDDPLLCLCKYKTIPAAAEEDFNHLSTFGDIEERGERVERRGSLVCSCR